MQPIEVRLQPPVKWSVRRAPAPALLVPPSRPHLAGKVGINQLRVPILSPLYYYYSLISAINTWCTPCTPVVLTKGVAWRKSFLKVSPLRPHQSFSPRFILALFFIQSSEFSLHPGEADHHWGAIWDETLLTVGRKRSEGGCSSHPTDVMHPHAHITWPNQIFIIQFQCSHLTPPSTTGLKPNSSSHFNSLYIPNPNY